MASTILFTGADMDPADEQKVLGWYFGRHISQRAALPGFEAARKFEAICRAQGGMRIPPVAARQRPVEAPWSGAVLRIDNRRLSRLAKLAGAPAVAAA